MYKVSSALYREAARRLAEAIGDASYFSDSVCFRHADTDCRLTTSVIVYRERTALPEGERDEMVDLVPVWWEFHTGEGLDEVPNDFSFDLMKRYL